MVFPVGNTHPRQRSSRVHKKPISLLDQIRRRRNRIRILRISVNYDPTAGRGPAGTRSRRDGGRPILFLRSQTDDAFLTREGGGCKRRLADCWPKEEETSGARQKHFHLLNPQNTYFFLFFLGERKICRWQADGQRLKRFGARKCRSLISDRRERVSRPQDSAVRVICFRTGIRMRITVNPAQVHDEGGPFLCIQHGGPFRLFIMSFSGGW